MSTFVRGAYTKVATTGSVIGRQRATAFRGCPVMKTWKERGPYGRWLVTARLARDLNTTAEARDALAAAGITIGASTYAAYESGSKTPSRNDLPRLEAFWGPFSDPLGATETPDELVSALRDQTAEMARLTDELARGRVDQQEATDALLRALATLVREPEGTSTDSERDARVDTPGQRTQGRVGP